MYMCALRLPFKTSPNHVTITIGRAGVPHIIVMLSDGAPTWPPAPQDPVAKAKDSATYAKGNGTRLVTIGYNIYMWMCVVCMCVRVWYIYDSRLIIFLVIKSRDCCGDHCDYDIIIIICKISINLNPTSQALMNEMASLPASIFALTVVDTKNLEDLLLFIVGRVYMM